MRGGSSIECSSNWQTRLRSFVAQFPFSKDLFGALPRHAPRSLCVSALSLLSSPNFDSRLTLSIPCICLALKSFHRRALEQFDTLSVYRGSLCEQVARARTACSTNLQRLSGPEK